MNVPCHIVVKGLHQDAQHTWVMFWTSVQSQLYLEGGDVCVHVCYENVFALQFTLRAFRCVVISVSRARRASHRGSKN